MKRTGVRGPAIRCEVKAPILQKDLGFAFLGVDDDV